MALISFENYIHVTKEREGTSGSLSKGNYNDQGAKFPSNEFSERIHELKYIICDSPQKISSVSVNLQHKNMHVRTCNSTQQQSIHYQLTHMEWMVRWSQKDDHQIYLY